MRIYVAGPMTGLHHYNFPAFDHAARYLRTLGHFACSPAEHDREVLGVPFEEQPTSGQLAGVSIREALEWDLTWICRHAEAIAVLTGWEASSGARAEVSLGLALNLLILPWRAWPPAGRMLDAVIAPGVRITTLPPDPRQAERWSPEWAGITDYPEGNPL